MHPTRAAAAVDGMVTGWFYPRTLEERPRGLRPPRRFKEKLEFP
jgi:hypothetical protein